MSGVWEGDRELCPITVHDYRNLVKNLVMGYFHASEHKKPEVVQLIGKILEFTQEELDQVHMNIGLTAARSARPAPPALLMLK